MELKRFVYLGQFKGEVFIILNSDLDLHNNTNLLIEIQSDAGAFRNLARTFPMTELDSDLLFELALSDSKFMDFFRSVIDSIHLYRWERATNKVQLLSGN